MDGKEDRRRLQPPGEGRFLSLSLCLSLSLRFSISLFRFSDFHFLVFLISYFLLFRFLILYFLLIGFSDFRFFRFRFCILRFPLHFLQFLQAWCSSFFRGDFSRRVIFDNLSSSSPTSDNILVLVGSNQSDFRGE